MEGIAAITRAQQDTLVQLIKLQKKKTGFTIRELAYASRNKSTSAVHMKLGMLVKKGLATGNCIDETTAEGKRLAARFSYKTDIDLVEHDGVVALVRMFD